MKSGSGTSKRKQPRGPHRNSEAVRAFLPHLPMIAILGTPVGSDRDSLFVLCVATRARKKSNKVV